MTARRPLVTIAGYQQELPVGDTLIGAGGAPAFTEVTLNFGAAPVISKSFSFADALVTTASKIIMSASGAPASGRQADELEMDNFMCAATCIVNGTVTAYVSASSGFVSGQYKFNYLLG